MAIGADADSGSVASLLREGRRFVATGLVQLAINWLVFVASTAAGLPVAPANILGRITGAQAGFWINGRYTFGKPRLDWAHAMRFALAWTALTALSTVLVSSVAARIGLHAAWLAKPLVEGCVACVAFFVWKLFVYR